MAAAAIIENLIFRHIVETMPTGVIQTVFLPTISRSNCWIMIILQDFFITGNGIFKMAAAAIIENLIYHHNLETMQRRVIQTGFLRTISWSKCCKVIVLQDFLAGNGSSKMAAAAIFENLVFRHILQTMPTVVIQPASLPTISRSNYQIMLVSHGFCYRK